MCIYIYIYIYIHTVSTRSSVQSRDYMFRQLIARTSLKSRREEEREREEAKRRASSNKRGAFNKAGNCPCSKPLALFLYFPPSLRCAQPPSPKFRHPIPPSGFAPHPLSGHKRRASSRLGRNLLYARVVCSRHWPRDATS